MQVSDEPVRNNPYDINNFQKKPNNLHDFG